MGVQPSCGPSSKMTARETVGVCRVVSIHKCIYSTSTRPGLGRGSYLPISFPSGKDSGGYPRDEVEWIIS